MELSKDEIARFADSDRADRTAQKPTIPTLKKLIRQIRDLIAACPKNNSSFAARGQSAKEAEDTEGVIDWQVMLGDVNGVGASQVVYMQRGLQTEMRKNAVSHADLLAGKHPEFCRRWAIFAEG